MIDMLWAKWQQNLKIKKHSATVNRVVVYLVDSDNGINGGYMSIFSMCAQSRHLLATESTAVVMATYPGIPYTTTRYTKFKNDEFIYRFNLISKHFSEIETLIIHVPEYWSMKLLTQLSHSEKNWLKSIPSVQINILNQNIEQLPAPDKLAKLRELTTNLTMTTAHHAYSTEAFQKQYGMPVQLLTTYVSPQFYNPVSFGQKKNQLVYSNDNHPKKEQILNKLKKHCPHLTLIEVKDMTYETYKKVISESKYALTFGEGFDNYFIEPYFSGSISFSVYNETFFPTPLFKSFTSIFASYDVLEEELVDTLEALNNKQAYTDLNKAVTKQLEEHYNFSRYKDRIKAFYEASFSRLG